MTLDRGKGGLFFFGILGLVIVVFLAGCQTLEENDMSRLQGTWLSEKAGAQKPQFAMTFSENNIKFEVGTWEIFSGTFTVNPAVNPKEIDIVISNEDSIGGTSLGIYKIVGNNLSLITDEAGSGKRPKIFDEGEGLVVLTKEPITK